MQKNVSGQKWRVYAWDTTTGGKKTGDAANITAKISKDFGSHVATDDANPTEVEGGVYEFDLTQDETDADDLHLIPVSTTANIEVVAEPPNLQTVPPSFGDLEIESGGTIGEVVVLTGHTPQTGDSFSRIGATGSGLTSLAQASVLAVARKLLQNRKEFDLDNSKMYVWNDAGSAREYEADLTDNDGDPVTVSTQGPINCSRWTEI